MSDQGFLLDMVTLKELILKDIMPGFTLLCCKHLFNSSVAISYFPDCNHKQYNMYIIAENYPLKFKIVNKKQNVHKTKAIH